MTFSIRVELRSRLVGLYLLLTELLESAVAVYNIYLILNSGKNLVYVLRLFKLGEMVS